MKTFPARERGFLLLLAAGIGLGVCSSLAQPANDLFFFRSTVAGTNVVVMGNNAGATREANEPYHAGKVGGASIWWSWKAPADGSVTISTAGSSFDTLLGVYTGVSVSTLTEVASNDDENFAAGITTSRVAADVSSNQTCQIAVDGFQGALGTVRLQIQFGPPLPPPPAPAWVLPDPYGVIVNSSNYAGKVVILDYWGTWCGECRSGMPDLVALQDKYRADGLVVVGANPGLNGDNPGAVQFFLASFTPEINYQIVMASFDMMQVYGGIDVLPTTFIIDRQNLIRKKYVGARSGAALEKEIIPLLYPDTRLVYRVETNQLVLSWPVTAEAFTLESATNLANAAWSAWPTSPTVSNGTNVVSVPADGTPRYFRLHLAY